MPGVSEIVGGENEAAVADEPTAGRRLKAHGVKCAPRLLCDGRVNDLMSGKLREAASGTGDGARFRVDKIAGEPAGVTVCKDWLPSGAAILRGEHAGRMRGSRVADGDAQIAIEELNASEPRQEDARQGSPRLTAVFGAQDNAARGEGGWLGLATGSPAAASIDEEYRVQPAGYVRWLLLPSCAAVMRMPDDAAVSDGPAGGVIDEEHISERGIVAEDLEVTCELICRRYLLRQVLKGKRVLSACAVKRCERRADCENDN
jgi:hypothetical protein